MRRILLGLLATACTHRAQPTFEMEAGAQTIIYALESPGRSPELFAVNESLRDHPIAVEESQRLIAIPYAHSVRELQVALGRVAPAETEDGRPLPEAPSFVRESGADEWTRLEALPPSLAGRILLPALDLDRCVLDGGCLEVGDRSLCTIPCPPNMAPAPPMSPDPPMPPNLRAARECVAPWTPASGVIALCEPPAHRDPASCPSGQMIVPYEDACVEPDDPRPCGTEELATDLIDPLSRAIFVRPGGTTLEEAFASVGAGERVTIAIAAGELAFAQSTTVAGDVTLLGVCTARTTISGPYLGTTESLVFRNLAVEIGRVGAGPGASLAFEGARFAGDRIDTRGALEAHHALLAVRVIIAHDARVHFERSLLSDGATLVYGSTTTVDRTMFAGHRIYASRGSAAVRDAIFVDRGPANIHCLYADHGARMIAERVATEGPCTAISVFNTATATITDVDARASDSPNTGIIVQQGASAVLRGIRVAGHVSGGGSFARVHLEDAEFSGGDYGWISDGGDFIASRVYAHDMALDAFNLQGDARIEDVYATRLDAALAMDTNYAVRAERFRVESTRMGINAGGDTSTSTITDFDASGVSIALYLLGGSMVARRFAVNTSEAQPVYVGEPCARVVFEDLAISGAGSPADEASFAIENGASARIDRARFSEVRGVVMQFQTKAEFRCPVRPLEFVARDVVIDSPVAVAIVADTDDLRDVVELERVALAGGPGVGARFRGPIAASVKDLRISGGAGVALDVELDGEVRCEQFSIEDADIAVRSSASCSLRHGVVSGSRIGVELTSAPSVDPAVFLERVSYRGVADWLSP